MADLKLTGVEKTYGGAVNVLNNINLDIINTHSNSFI
jgi:alpha-glucoside transport system ATP-binding protein